MSINIDQNIGFRSSGATIQLAYPTAISGGALLTLEACGSSLVVSTITDSAGNLWKLAVDCMTTLGQKSQIWYAENAIGSTNTLTITSEAPTNQLQLSAQSWSGCSTAFALQAVSSHALVTASTHTPGSVSPTPSTMLFIVNYAFVSAFDIISDPVGYVALNSTFTSMQSFFRITTSTTTENPEVTSSNTEITVNVIAAFSGGSQAAPPSGSKRRYGLALMGVG